MSPAGSGGAGQPVPAAGSGGSNPAGTNAAGQPAPAAGSGGSKPAGSGGAGNSAAGGAGAAAAGSGAGAGTGGSSGGGAGSGGSSGGSGNLRWYMTCGDPVCRNDTGPSDDPSVPNCTSEKLGDPCSTQGKLCDGVASCGAKLICAASDPTRGPGGCPISRARFKEQIEYLTPEQLRSYRDQLLGMRLAAYRYKYAPEAGPQLGFIIDDVEPSAAVSGDHVNVYGYLSMAVAAIQDQQRQIDQLERELAEMRARTAGEAICGP